MRKALRVIAIIVLQIAATTAGMMWYYVVCDAPHPADRPDLARLPAGLPEPPHGFPTLRAAMLGYVLGLVDIIDIHKKMPVPEGIEEHKDIEYGKVGGFSLKVDYYCPAKLDHPVPGLIFVHGGGWTEGNRTEYKYYQLRFAQRGYVAASISYRFARVAGFPGCVEDAKCAVRWMRANAAALYVDPDRIAIIGGSAGGYLAMMVGYTAGVPELEGGGGWPGVSSAVAAVVDEYGPVDLTVPMARAHPTITGFLKKKYEENNALYEFASPISHLSKDSPPTLIVQGTIDDIVPAEQSDALAGKCKELGVPYYYDRLKGFPHTLDVVASAAAWEELVMSAFFDEVFTKK